MSIRRRWLAAAVAGLAAGAMAVPAVAQADKLEFTEQVQEQNQWCWVATGLSIAQFLGKGKDMKQNDYCNAGFGSSGQCRNQPGEMKNIQNGLKAAGVTNTGRKSGPMQGAAVDTEVKASRPIETGVYWTAGGGHARVIYGYDTAGQNLYFSDPWPQSERYQQMRLSSYTNNGEFRWAEALSGISAS